MSLLDLSKEKFIELVDRDIREQTSQADHDELRSPPVRPLWVSTLIRSKKDIEWQLSNEQAARAEERVNWMQRGGTDLEWLEYVATQERWRANTLRVLKGIEKCLAEVPALDNGTPDVLESAEMIRDALEYLFQSDDEGDRAAMNILVELYESLSGESYELLD